MLVRPIDSAAAAINSVFTHLHGHSYAPLVGTIEATLNLLRIVTDWLLWSALQKNDSATCGLRRCWRPSEGIPGKQACRYSEDTSEDYLENSEKQSQVKKFKRQIDQLVYKIYELTPKEIALVEER